MRICKNCGRELSDAFFYKGRAVCKFCLSKKYAEKVSGVDADNFRLNNEKPTISRIDKMMKILKENGNVLINERLDLEEIENKVGFKVTVRDSDGGGYIYERVKSN